MTFLPHFLIDMTLNNFVSSCELWLRLAMFILGPLRDGLINVLHNNGVPKDPKDLYSFLVSKRTILVRLKGKGVITQPQWNLLFPPGKDETDCNLFDITLIVLLIEALTPIAPNDGNWRNNPPDTDTSVGAFCIRGKIKRNFLNHCPDITALNGSEFLLKWNELLIILHGLNYNSPFNVNDLKTVSLDLKNNLLLRSIILANQIKLNDHDNELNELRNDKMSFENCHDIELNELRNSNVILENRITSNVTSLRIELVDMQIKLWNNSLESDDLLKEIEGTHISIMEMQNDIASLKNNVKDLSNRTEVLEKDMVKLKDEQKGEVQIPMAYLHVVHFVK